MSPGPPHLEKFLSRFAVPFDLANFDPVKRRGPMEKLAEKLGIAKDVIFASDIIADVPCEWVSAETSRDDSVIVWLHGGGFSAGSCVTHRAMAGELARAAQARVLVIDYPLAPESQFPAALHAAIAVFVVVAARPDIANLGLGGDSAGGALALGIAIAARKAANNLPQAIVLFSPWLDLTCDAMSFATHKAVDRMVDRAILRQMAGHYLGETDARDSEASPLFADLTGLPPILVQTGSSEVLLDDTLALDRKARASGVSVTLEVWPAMIHGFQIYGQFLPEAGTAIEGAGRFCQKVWADK